jgi:Ankyrin repeats (3 copies)
MAPEFFPFIGFGMLVLVLVAGLGAAAVLFVIRLVLRHRQSPHWARRLVTMLCCASLVGVMLVSLCLVLLGGKIRQQYFLNEPFVSACGDGDLAKARELLARGASPDAYGIDFVDTALSAAAASGHREIVALLLRSGAHIDQKDSNGKTAAERARENGHGEIAQMIEASKNNPPKT